MRLYGCSAQKGWQEIRVVGWVGRLDRAKRNAWRPTPNDSIHSNPIYRVPTPPTFWRVYLANTKPHCEKGSRRLICMMELDCLMPFLSPTIVSPARHTDGQTRTRQNLSKRYHISIHLRLNHGPCRSHEQRTNSTQLNALRLNHGPCRSHEKRTNSNSTQLNAFANTAPEYFTIHLVNLQQACTTCKNAGVVGVSRSVHSAPEAQAYKSNPLSPKLTWRCNSGTKCLACACLCVFSFRSQAPP